VDNRLASIEAKTIAGEERDSVAATAADLSRADRQPAGGAGALGLGPVHGSALCSVRDIEFPIGAPQYDAAKEDVEDVLVVAATANVPSYKHCIQL